MGSLSEDEDHFFDVPEDIISGSDSGSDELDNLDSDLSGVDLILSRIGYEFWMKTPESIYERRDKFLKWMGLGVGVTTRERPQNMNSHESEVDIVRITNNSGVVLRTSGFGGHSSSESSMYSSLNDDQVILDWELGENFVCRIKNLDDGTEFLVEELGQDGMLRRLREVGSNRLITVEEFERTLGLSPLVQQVMRREVEDVFNLGMVRKQAKKGWLTTLGAVACIVNREVEADSLKYADSYPNIGARTRAVKVHPRKKRSKEISALYAGQDILAYEGSILTLKFSPDGQYLASAGEDGIVRVWQTIESERSDDLHVPDVDPSFVNFTVNDLSELVPIYGDKEKKSKLKSMKKLSDAACVIFPKKVFRLSEKPLHEFHGHCGEVLDLSWSKNKCLLSSSVDKTVRLWRVGSDKCLKVFTHNNYVTCVQFNPVDDNYFISGSIDGKVRIWEIPGCQVVDWNDIKEIVTAVCYSPDGKGGIVGSLTGSCRFYDASDNRLQLDAQVCLQGKNKSPFKRITGFQFSPTDPDKLMVTSADSHIQILHGIDVICRYRGIRKAGSQMSASFTSDGMHIVSASDDSNVYIWNYICQDGPRSYQMKNNSSCERFFSSNACIAIPWCGMTCRNSLFSHISRTPELSVNLPKPWSANGSQQCSSAENSHNLPFASPDLSLRHGVFSDSLPKGSATWPEENLPIPSSLAVSSTMCKSHYKLLKASCQSMFGCPQVWGLVIVTAGRDGRIRSFQNYGLPIRI